jgi:hypothetical protein
MDLPCNASSACTSRELLPNAATTNTSASAQISSVHELIAHCEQALQKCDSDIRNNINKIIEDNSTIEEQYAQFRRSKLSRECQVAFLTVMYPLANSTKKPGDEEITKLLEESDIELESMPEETAAVLEEYMQHRKILRGHETKIRELVIPEFISGSGSSDPNLPDILTFIDNQCAAVIEKMKLLWPRVRDFRMKYDEYPSLDCLTDIMLKQFFARPMQWKPPEGHRFFPDASDASKDKRARDDSEVDQSQMSPDKKTKRTPPSPKTSYSPKDGKEPASPKMPASPKDDKAQASPLSPKTKIDHHAFPRVRPNYVDPWPFISDWNPMCDACGKVFDDHSNVGRQIQFHKGRWCRNTRRIYQSDMPNNGGSYNVVFVDQ